MNFLNGLSVRFVAFCATALMLSGCVTASKTVDFKWHGEDRRILLMPTDIELSELTAGGVEVPNAEWTAKAEEFFVQSMRDKLQGIDTQVVEAPSGLEQPQDQLELVKLYEVVGASAMRHSPGKILALPTKTEKPTWTLGDGTRVLKDRYGAEYALFAHVRDSYTSSGRAAAILVAAVMGVQLQGGTQRGYASLVDLNTGEVVWNNTLLRGNGNMRTADGARETTDRLLQGFPQ